MTNAQAKAETASPGKRAAIALLVTVVLAVGVAAVFGDGAYLWIKAIHVIAVISWMAGMMYLPRLFIYHCGAEKGSAQSETFKVMERRLLTIIMNPAMVIAWALGLWLVWQSGYYKSGWFIGKFVLVLLMSGAHGHFSAAVRAFAEDRNQKSAGYWRMVNEIPAVLMIGIVILVIVKPF